MVFKSLVSLPACDVMVSDGLQAPGYPLMYQAWARTETEAKKAAPQTAARVLCHLSYGFKPYHSKIVPRSSILEAARGDEPVTTLMLRNIPNKYTQNSLMQEICARGFRGAFDFFYLPMDVHNRSNVAYAFLNFISPKEAENFRNEFHGRQFHRVRSRKVAAVSNAHLQGLEANLQHFEHRVVLLSRNDQYRPVVFRNGHRVKFEDALNEVRAKQQSAVATATLESSAKVACHAGGALRVDLQENLHILLEARMHEALIQLPICGAKPDFSSFSSGIQEGRSHLAQVGLNDMDLSRPGPIASELIQSDGWHCNRFLASSLGPVGQELQDFPDPCKFWL
ncbi:Protein MEI2-like 3 [Symbiodinium microadriaticum]|uniref:Protein MEI2-like 3 n=1 Tax=Symbiodinium microadriaticum TaxID=2951 RepID=A0A1Q9CYL6_SYMMI|nr:Protein MEI2-like 3 [Symbiodinium microadriaticum]